MRIKNRSKLEKNGASVKNWRKRPLVPLTSCRRKRPAFLLSQASVKPYYDK